MTTPDPTQFDPSIHASKDGQPVLNADGSFRFRRGMREKQREVDTAQAVNAAIDALTKACYFRWIARRAVRHIAAGGVPGVTLK